MFMFSRVSIGAGLIAAALGPSMAVGEEALAFEEDVRPLIEVYCTNCHNPERLRGDLDLARFETMDMAVASIALWQRIGKRLENNEMPPKKRDQPTAEEKERILRWIKSLEIDDEGCDQIASEESQAWFPGFVMSRRLNRDEYENTVRDLFGVDMDIAERFPADGAGGEGFDNNGNALFVSSIQVEKYLEAADIVVERAFPTGMAFEDWPERFRVDAAWPLHRREAARQVIEEFLPRAWRRPASRSEVDGLMRLFDDAYDRGAAFEAALKLVLKGALVSPNFLFLAEPEPDFPGVYELDDFQLATRLSYFLWASLPDEELFRLARANRLRDLAVLEEQVKRMLKDPKAQALGERFAAQWLGIDRLGETTKPDADLFPMFDEALAADMRQEVAMFFTHVVQSDRSVLEFIDAEYTFANSRLAEIYDVDEVTSPAFERVALRDENRGGVLGMAAVLTATSHPRRTSPVLRGKWVLEQLLGDHVPPPPPGVGELEEPKSDGEPATLRARMELHREKEECASCHARMDPIGFGLENFDPIGRWRMEDGELPIDAAGELPSGDSFEGPRELKEILLKRKGAFVRNFARKMLGYALGRSLTRYDACVIEDSVMALEANDYRASALFTEIVLSYPFRHRYSGNQSE